MTCHTLLQALPESVFLPDSKQYKTSVSEYFYQQNRLAPQCVIRPKGPEDISSAVRILAADGDVKLAIRSCGHNTNRNFSNVDDGVTLDLRSMNQITLSDDKQTVSVHTGATWIEVYDILDPEGLSVPGGRDATIGTGGFIAGGGISLYGRKRGWGCDSVVNFQVVVASGEIVDANAAVNSDLFQALKGGLNNFGIITRIDFATFAQGKFMGGGITYPFDAADALIAAYTDYKTPKGASDPYEEINLSFLYLGKDVFGIGSPFLIFANTFYPSPHLSTDGLKRWQDITPQLASTVRESKMSDFAREIDSQQPRDKYSMYATTTFSLTSTFIPLILALWRTAVDDTFTQIPGSTAILSLLSVPRPPSSTPNNFPFSATSTPQDTLVLGLVNVYWDNAADGPVCEARALKLIRCIEELASREGVLNGFKYMNYAYAGQDVLGSYGEEEGGGDEGGGEEVGRGGVLAEEGFGGVEGAVGGWCVWIGRGCLYLYYLH